MLQEERKNLILKELEKSSVARLEDLSAMLGVSIDTVRRDLKAMDKAGLIQYVRGGAASIHESEQFFNFKGRQIIHIPEKQAASKKALAAVTAGDLILLNSGTTNTVFAAELAKSRIPCTVVTNNSAAAAAAAAAAVSPYLKVRLLGGDYDAEEQSTYGSRCLAEIEKLHPDLCFLSINSIDLDAGYTDFRPQEIPLIRAMTRVTPRSAAIMDSTKLGRCAKEEIYPLTALPIVYMDDGADKETKEAYAAAGVDIR